jgi:hypothetical protein
MTDQVEAAKALWDGFYVWVYAKGNPPPDGQNDHS